MDAVSDAPQQPSPVRSEPGVPAGDAVVQRTRASIVLTMQAKALAQERFAPAAAAVDNELALLVGCERVSLGFHVGGRIEVAAISNATDVRQGQNSVRAIASAMEESLEQRAAIIYPLPRAGAANASLARGNG